MCMYVLYAYVCGMCICVPYMFIHVYMCSYMFIHVYMCSYVSSSVTSYPVMLKADLGGGGKVGMWEEF